MNAGQEEKNVEYNHGQHGDFKGRSQNLLPRDPFEQLITAINHNQNQNDLENCF
jgi:hypothetical protein